MSTPTRHCHKCGWEYAIKGNPGRSESCHQCGADLRVCLNCLSYVPNLAHQCRDRRAEPVAEKHSGNFCEYFDYIRRPWQGAAAKDKSEQAARDKLKQLFGD